jgi:hypothetical protein
MTRKKQDGDTTKFIYSVVIFHNIILIYDFSTILGEALEAG